MRCYAVGLVAYSADKVLAPAFYALDKRHLPMFVAFISIAVNFCLNYFFTFHLKLGHRGLALSTSLVAFTNFLMLYTHDAALHRPPRDWRDDQDACQTARRRRAPGGNLLAGAALHSLF